MTSPAVRAPGALRVCSPDMSPCTPSRPSTPVAGAGRDGVGRSCGWWDGGGGVGCSCHRQQPAGRWQQNMIGLSLMLQAGSRAIPCHSQNGCMALLCQVGLPRMLDTHCTPGSPGWPRAVSNLTEPCSYPMAVPTPEPAAGQRQRWLLERPLPGAGSASAAAHPSQLQSPAASHTKGHSRHHQEKQVLVHA